MSIYQAPPYRRNYKEDTRKPVWCTGTVKHTNKRAATAAKHSKS